MKALWFFIKQLNQYRGQLLLGLLLSTILTASSIALLSLSGWFISACAFAGLSAATAALFNYFIPAGAVRFLALTRIASRYGERVINHDFTFKILTQLRVWFYQALLPLAPSHLIRYRSGELLNSMVNDIDTLDHLYLRVLSPCVIAVLTTLGVYWFIAHYSHLIADIALTALLVCLTVVPIIIFQKSKKIGEALSFATHQLRTQTVDLIQGLLPLLFYIDKNKRLTKTHAAHHALTNAQRQMAHLKGFAVAAMTLLCGLCIVGALYLGIPLVNHAHLSGAQLAMIMLCIIVTFEQILALPLAFLSLGKTQAAANRLLSVANQKPSVIFTSSNSDQTLTQADLRFQNICFQYPTRIDPTLSHLNLNIPFGTHCAITGPSGIGKTTLFHLLLRVWDPTSGIITLNNQALQNLSEKTLRQIITTVPQRVHIFNASVRDNLTLMCDNISDEKLFETLEMVELAQTIRALPNGLNTPMGEFGTQFSGGQIRRIGIARALLTDALIHLWDEPATGLNDDLLERIWGNCKSLLSDKTLLVVTHNQRLLGKLPQRICLNQLKNKLQSRLHFKENTVIMA